MAILAEPTGRVRSVVQQAGATHLVTDEGEVAVSAVAAPGAARGVLVSLRHVSYVRIDVEGDHVVSARVSGTTRVPVVREVPAGAAIHLASSGVPTFVRRVGAHR